MVYFPLNKHFILVSRKQDIILYTSTLLWFFSDVLRKFRNIHKKTKALLKRDSSTGVFL